MAHLPLLVGQSPVLSIRAAYGVLVFVDRAGKSHMTSFEVGFYLFQRNPAEPFFRERNLVTSVGFIDMSDTSRSFGRIRIRKRVCINNPRPN